ncbi:unnamed protein product [Lactuca saligna]|uniref:UDP-N-acetylglucosamine--peptide N-acetylglucosaminyltransferase SPINDLY n=1 Tax=Lactuca saligna TaxID=75948 RepID=A0AA36E2G1_LACSI|nr:unnamed protein product [Lactuca saligna]
MSQPPVTNHTAGVHTKPQLSSVTTVAQEESFKAPSRPHPPKIVVLADLNVDPPTDTEALDSFPRLNNEDNNQEKMSLLGKDSETVELEGVPSSREEKVSSLKTGLVHVSRKMPKNAHVHFILGLMYQRMGQPQKAVSAYEKAEEILLRGDEDIDRPDLLSLVQTHHAQCILLGSSEDYGSGKELEGKELEEILFKLNESMKSDVRQASVWNTLGVLLLKAGHLQNAISVLSSLLVVAPENLDCIGNLGMAHLQNGNLELSAKCFQDLIFKDQNHPSVFINYAALLLCKYGSIVAGAGANGDDGGCEDRVNGINVAKECLLAAAKADPKAAHVWTNLANAYFMAGDHRNSGKCLEKAAKLESNCLATRYAVAVHRIREAERSQNPSEQLSWAGNEMASILKEGPGESIGVELPIAWAGLAMVHKAQHEIAAGFKIEQNELMEVQERALYSLKQAISEDPEDPVQWHQLGLHSLCTQDFKTSETYLKAAVARDMESSYAWSNLGKAYVYNYRTRHLHKPNKQQKQYECAKAMFTKSLELQPGYAPAYNNLGLVFVAERRWEEAKFCFNKALEVDPLLDAAKSNMIKAMAMCRVCAPLLS